MQRGILVLLAFFVFAALVSTASTNHGAKLPLFRRSSDLGITRCAFQGAFGQEHAILNVWMRAFVKKHLGGVSRNSARTNSAALPMALQHRPGRAMQADSTIQDSGAWVLEVKGFAMLEDMDKNFTVGGPQMSNSAHAIEYFSHEVFLRPYHSQSHKYKLRVKSSDGKEGMVLAIWGTFPLQDVTPGSLWEFEIVITGINYVCSILAWADDAQEAAQHHPSEQQRVDPPSEQNTLRSSSEQEQAAETPSEPQGSKPTGGQPSSQGLPSTTAAAGLGAAGDTSKGLQRPGRTAFLVSPFFDMPSGVFASLLAWHISWHTKLGVDLYLVYVSHDMGPLLAEPLIQQLVQEGLLVLVWWEDLPEFAGKRRSSHVAYEHQILIYNHGMLALHAQDTVILVADLDEYLVTHKQMHVRQVMSECFKADRSGSFSPGSLRLLRYDVYCPVSIKKRQAELRLWLGNSSHGKEGSGAGGRQDPRQQGLLPDASGHPLAHYSISTAVLPRKFYKSMHRPEHNMRVHVHYGQDYRAGPMADADGACARWLHVVNLIKLRVPEPQMAVIEDKWLWPIKAAAAAAGS